MKKTEIEKLMICSEGVGVLTERAQELKKIYGENVSSACADAERVVVVKQMAHEKVQSVDEIEANDHDVAARSELMPDITQFIPEFTEFEPRSLLRTLCKKYAKEPSLSEQLIIENVINKITSIGQVSPDDEKVIDGAIELLMAAGKPSSGIKKTGGGK